MAKLSAHGQNLQIEYIDYKVAICSDGHILRNTGDGWKLWKKLKPGINWRDHYAKRLENLQELIQSRPAFAAYRKVLMRWKLEDRRHILLAFHLLGDDTDGIWSELADMGPRVDIDMEEIQEIHTLMRASRIEAEHLKASEAPPPQAAPPQSPQASALNGF